MNGVFPFIERGNQQQQEKYVYNFFFSIEQKLLNR